MAIYQGNQNLSVFKLGSNNINSVYRGKGRLFPPVPPPPTNGLLVWVDAQSYDPVNKVLPNKAATGSAYNFSGRIDSWNGSSLYFIGTTLYGKENYLMCANNPIPSLSTGQSIDYTMIVTFNPQRLDNGGTNCFICGWPRKIGAQPIPFTPCCVTGTTAAKRLSCYNGNAGSAPTPLQVNNWYMGTVVGNWNNSNYTFDLRVDNNASTGVVSSVYTYATSLSNLYIGFDGGYVSGDPFQGRIGSFYIYNRKLSNSEVFQIYDYENTIFR